MVPLLHHRTHLVPWMRLLQGFFRTFHQNQQSARLGPHSESELGADFNPWAPMAYADSMVLEEDGLGTESGSGVCGGGGGTRFNQASPNYSRPCPRYYDQQCQGTYQHPQRRGARPSPLCQPEPLQYPKQRYSRLQLHRGLSTFFVFLFILMGEARLSGHDLVSGAGHRSLDCGGISHP